MIAPTLSPSNAKQEPLEWVTPDDFLVKLSPANLGERLGAFLLDTALLVAVTIVLVLGALVVGSLFSLVEGELGHFVGAVLVLAQFFLWNGYWVFFEWRRMGMTPGKRALGIQVIRPHHGVLNLASALTRSMVREVEVWLPFKILILFRFGAIDQGSAFLWCLGLLLVPLFSRNHRRVGDYLAGTCVVKRPPFPELPRDILGARARKKREVQEERYAFTTAMLEIYGTTQLNALQEVLDGPTSQAWGGPRVLLDIKDRVVDKIGYAEPVADGEARDFLLAFYRAMREYLEGQLASGRSTLKSLKKSSTSARRRRSRWERFFEPPE